MNKLVGQLTLIGISGHALTSEEKKFIVENNIGGVTLFGRNVADPKQIRDLCAELQSLRHQMKDKAPLFIGIDMEGGRVHRLKSPFTVWPPLKKLGDIDNATVSFHFAHRMGMELNAVGINLDYAPCVDVFTNPKNTAIGDRSISHDPRIVEKHSSALVRGYVKANILSCAKHFPGHGNTIVDSHEELPVEQADLAQLESCELIPFKKAFKSRVDMVMTSHILFPKIDPKWPATLSEIFLKKLIRDDFRYRGLIITDDLGMKAMTKNYSLESIPVRALQAGADLLLYCNEPETPPLAIESVVNAVAQGQLQKSHLESIHQRVLALKKEKITHPDPMPFTEAIQIIGHTDHLKFAASVASGKDEVPSSFIE